MHEAPEVLFFVVRVEEPQKNVATPALFPLSLSLSASRSCWGKPNTEIVVFSSCSNRSPSKPFGNFFTLLHKVMIHWKTSGKDALHHAAIFCEILLTADPPGLPLTPECWFECTIHTGVEWMQILCCFLRNQSWIWVCPLDGCFHRSCFYGPSCCPKQAMHFFFFFLVKWTILLGAYRSILLTIPSLGYQLSTLPCFHNYVLWEFVFFNSADRVSCLKITIGGSFSPDAVQSVHPTHVKCVLSCPVVSTCLVNNPSLRQVKRRRYFIHTHDVVWSNRVLGYLCFSESVEVCFFFPL